MIHRFFRWLNGLWCARLRKLDLQILWPQIRAGANDLDHAKAAFMHHCMIDHAWLILGEAEIARRVDKLA
jgi:hypothetical protein